MINELLNEAKASMEKIIESAVKSISRIRAGKAHPSMIENIRVEYYNSLVPLSQISTIQAADTRLIIIKPYDKNFLPVIEKAIQKSDIGINLKIMEMLYICLYLLCRKKED